MINVLKGFIITISTYTAIPMPQITWKNSYNKYVFIFFPLIGLLIGGVELLWYNISIKLSINTILYGVIASLIPVIITGGIHLDGYIDTIDSLSSNLDKESMQRILKDSHIGAFGVIYLIVYFLLLFGLFCQLHSNNKYYLFLLVIFFASRILGSFASITIKTFKTSGFLYTFSSVAEKTTVILFLSLYSVLLIIFLYYFYDYIFLLLFIFSVILIHLYFIKVYRKFGGISGDLIGFYIQILEVIFLILIVVLGVL